MVSDRILSVIGDSIVLHNSTLFFLSVTTSTYPRGGGEMHLLRQLHPQLRRNVQSMLLPSNSVTIDHLIGKGEDYLVIIHILNYCFTLDSSQFFPSSMLKFWFPPLSLSLSVSQTLSLFWLVHDPFHPTPISLLSWNIHRTLFVSRSLSRDLWNLSLIA